MSERVAVFIDGSNLYHCLKDECNKVNIDFAKLAEILRDGRKLIRTYYYNAVVSQQDDAQRHRDQQRFFEKLRNASYLELRLGRLERRGNTYVEKGVDVQIATDMIRSAHQDAYDTAILVSGDADFVPAVQLVKDFGKHVENAFCRTGRSRFLQQTCDRFTLLDAAKLGLCWIV
jgi:uncharacterized LabA/DUF88 family protein